MSLYVFLLLISGTLGYEVGFQCGLANRAGSKIVGGNETEVNEYPWQAHLTTTIGSYTYLCGGFLIDERRIVSAAHCFFSPGTYQKASQVDVGLGEHSRSNSSAAAVYHVVFMDEVRIHEGYVPGNNDHDIAIIYLQEKVDWILHPKIRPVCLPPATATVDSYQGSVAVATGWGRTIEGGSTSDVLLEVDLRITPQQDCVNAYAPKRITDGMVCAGPAARSGDACQGDSGGPLVVLNSSYNQYEVIGLTSWGRGCDRLKYPGVYTRISHYLLWIEEQDMTCSIPPLPTTSVVMQRRIRGGPATAFAKDWIQYEQGFSGNGELWLGLKEIHRMTSSGSFGLLVRLTDWDDRVYEAHYDNFQVGSAPDYQLSISGFNAGLSSLGDSITGSANLNGMKFSTRDRDNDEYSGYDCSREFRGSGGWWFRACGNSGLNGENSQTQENGRKYINWWYGGDRGDGLNSWADSEMLLK